MNFYTNAGYNEANDYFIIKKSLSNQLITHTVYKMSEMKMVKMVYYNFPEPRDIFKFLVSYDQQSKTAKRGVHFKWYKTEK